MTKNWNNLTAEKFVFFYEKLQLSSPLVSRKYFQATAEAFTLLKRTSSTSKHDFFYLFLWVFLSSCNPNPGPDPADQNQSGSETLQKSEEEKYVKRKR
jgi:hypothetical protein